MKWLWILLGIIIIVIVLMILIACAVPTSTSVPGWMAQKQFFDKKAPTIESVDSAVMLKDGHWRTIDKVGVWAAMHYLLRPEALREAGRDDQLDISFKDKSGHTEKRGVKLFNVDWDRNDLFTQFMSVLWGRGKEYKVEKY
jgi:hypothetical protein